MALKNYNPTTASRRSMELSDFQEVTKRKPERSLLRSKKSRAGRNGAGRTTVRHRGGGHKRRYRMVDFRRDKDGIPATVAAIEYDPNRTARLALLHYADGEKRYILASGGMQVGQKVISGLNVEVAEGNNLPLAGIPLGTQIHNLEVRPQSGGKLVRSAGRAGVVTAHGEKYTNVKLPSGEVRMFKKNCRATVGVVGNVEHRKEVSGKAGRTRWKGVRPTVRGVVMNPIDHPMGGGEGRTSGGGDPVSPWSKLAKGGKTRKRSKASNKNIVKRRK